MPKRGASGAPSDAGAEAKQARVDFRKYLDDLEHPDFDVSGEAAEDARRMWPREVLKDHETAILQCLKNSNWYVRRAALMILAQFEPLKDVRTRRSTAIVQCLEDEDKDVRKAAVGASSHSMDSRGGG